MQSTKLRWFEVPKIVQNCHIHKHAHTHTHTHMHTRTHTHTHTLTHTHHTHALTHTHTHTRTHTHSHTHTHTHTHTQRETLSPPEWRAYPCREFSSLSNRGRMRVKLHLQHALTLFLTNTHTHTHLHSASLNPITQNASGQENGPQTENHYPSRMVNLTNADSSGKHRVTLSLLHQLLILYILFVWHVERLTLFWLARYIRCRPHLAQVRESPSGASGAGQQNWCRTFWLL